MKAKYGGRADFMSQLLVHFLRACNAFGVYCLPLEFPPGGADGGCMGASGELHRWSVKGAESVHYSEVRARGPLPTVMVRI